VVLIDTPPALPVTDAVALAARADATVLVVGANKTTKTQARRAIEVLSRVDAAPVGVIVNRVQADRGNLYYGYGYGYGYGHGPRHEDDLRPTVSTNGATHKGSYPGPNPAAGFDDPQQEDDYGTSGVRLERGDRLAAVRRAPRVEAPGGDESVRPARVAERAPGPIPERPEQVPEAPAGRPALGESRARMVLRPIE